MVEIRIEAPRLRCLFVDSSDFLSKLKMKVEASNLEEISVSYPRHPKDISLSIECHQVIWKGNVLLKRGVWNISRDLMLLEVQSATPNKLLILKDLPKYAKLKILNLSGFKSRPIPFWEMLCHLPLLEALTLSQCNYEGGDFDVSKHQDVDLETSKGTGTETQRLDREIRLTEIKISMSGDEMHGYFSGEREMFRLFW